MPLPTTSVIIPFHKTDYLMESLASVMSQTEPATEIVLVPNNAAAEPLAYAIWMRDIEERFGAPLTARLKVHPVEVPCDVVGALKRVGFRHATGDVLVELDVDDMLMPTALAEIAEAFTDEQVGFVYSENAMLPEPGQDVAPFDAAYGWEHELFPYAPPQAQAESETGDEEEWFSERFHSPARDILSATRQLIRNKAFAPSAASFAFIWYAPDHVRAWRRAAYHAIGEHNPRLAVCDDHELMIRSYLHLGVKQLDACLYLYRVTGDNTSRRRSDEIQRLTQQLYAENGFKLAERWADLKGLKKVDLGAAFNKPHGYYGLDKHEAPGVDLVCNLEQGIPLPDNSVGVLRAHHFVEHLGDKMMVMQEAWRVLADGGWLMIEVPSADGKGAHADPTHVSFWNELAFKYWTRREQADYIGNARHGFQAFRLDTGYPNDYFRENEILCVTAWLSAIKSGVRRPHPNYFSAA